MTLTCSLVVFKILFVDGVVSAYLSLWSLARRFAVVPVERTQTRLGAFSD